MPGNRSGSVIRPVRTDHHDHAREQPVFWIGLLAGLVVLSVLPTVIAVFRRVENIAVVVFLNVCRLPG